MHSRNEYPRPQLQREQWLPLNGQWQFEFDDNDSGLVRNLHKGSTQLSSCINVPFCYQYPASGIGDQTYHKTMWYKRSFSLDTQQRKQRALLCFNGCDYIADVWVNGIHAITHRGAYSAFHCDITDYVRKDNTIVVRCIDPSDPTIPRGKQNWIPNKYGCWYVPNSGIWQSVWLEFFGEDCLDSYSLIPDIDRCAFGGELVTLYGKADLAKFTVFFNNQLIKTQTVSLDGKYTRYDICLMEDNFVDESYWWSTDKPNLIYVDIELLRNDKVRDRVHTRFGMRKISINDDGVILLNNRPLYQRLILDQGYFEESGITPPSAQALKRDIELSLAMGFNGARKHQKIEDPYYCYYAEEMGFLVWCEMPSAYNFNACQQQMLMSEWQEIVRCARNLTSVVCYVPLNESWGVRRILSDSNQQNFARAMYYATKALDSSRIISTNDGWENIVPTDIISIHDYAETSDGFGDKYSVDNLDRVFPSQRKLMAEGNKYSGQPVLLSEFGGIAMQNEAVDGNWGYNSGAKNTDEFYSRYGALLKGVHSMWWQGFCYTQLTDVQQEVNGLLDSKHMPKFDIATIKALTQLPN